MLDVKEFYHIQLMEKYKLILCLVSFVFLTFFASNIFVEAIATIINPFAFSVFGWCFTIAWAVICTKCFTFIFPEIVCSIYEHGWYFSAAICTINYRLSRSYTLFRSSALFFIGYFCPIWMRKETWESLRRSIFNNVHFASIIIFMLFIMYLKRMLGT